MKTINRPDMYYKPLDENNVQSNEKLTFKKRIINRIKKITLKDVLIFPFRLIFHIYLLPFHILFGFVSVLIWLSEMLSRIPVIGGWIMFLPQIAVILMTIYLCKKI